MTKESRGCLALSSQRSLRKRFAFLLREIALEGRDGCSLPKAFELLETSLERRRKLRENGETNETENDEDKDIDLDAEEDVEDEIDDKNKKKGEKLKRLLFQSLVSRSSLAKTSDFNTLESMEMKPPDVHFMVKIPEKCKVTTTESEALAEIDAAEKFIVRESFEFRKSRRGDDGENNDKNTSNKSSSKKRRKRQQQGRDDEKVDKCVITFEECFDAENANPIMLVASLHVREAVLSLTDARSWEQVISPFSRRILEFVAKRRQHGATTAELSADLNMKPAKIDPHARQLEGLRLGLRRKVFRQETRTTESGMWLPEFVPRKATALSHVMKKKYVDRLFTILEEAGKAHAVPIDDIKPEMAKTLNGLIYGMNPRRSQKLFGELRNELVEKKCILLGVVNVEDENTGKIVAKEALQLIERPQEYTYTQTLSMVQGIGGGNKNAQLSPSLDKEKQNELFLSKVDMSCRDSDNTSIPWVKDDPEYEPSQYTMWTGNGSRELVLQETYEHQLLERIAKSSAGVTTKTLGIELDIATKPMQKKLEKCEVFDKLLNRTTIRAGSNVNVYYKLKETIARKRGIAMAWEDENLETNADGENNIAQTVANKPLDRNQVRLEYVKAHILDKGFAFQSRLSSWLAKKEGHGLTRIDVTQIKQIVEALLQREKFSHFVVRGLSGKQDTVLCSPEFFNSIDVKNLTEEFITNMLVHGEQQRLAKRKKLENCGIGLPQLQAFEKEISTAATAMTTATKSVKNKSNTGSEILLVANENEMTRDDTKRSTPPLPRISPVSVGIPKNPVDVPFERLRYENALRFGMFRSHALRCRALHLHLIQNATNGCISAHELRKNIPVKLHFQLTPPPNGLTATQLATLYVAVIQDTKFHDLDKTLAKAAYDSDAIGDVLKGLKNMGLWTYGTTTSALKPLSSRKRKAPVQEDVEYKEELSDIDVSLQLADVGTYVKPEADGGKRKIEMNITTVESCKAYWNALETTFTGMKFDINMGDWSTRPNTIAITQKKNWDLSMIIQNPKEALLLSNRFEDLWKRWVQSSMDEPHPNHAQRRYPTRDELSKPENTLLRASLGGAQRKVGLKPVITLKETPTLAFVLKQIVSDTKEYTGLTEKRADDLWKIYGESVQKTLVGGHATFGVDGGKTLGVKSTDSGVITEDELQRIALLTRQKSQRESSKNQNIQRNNNSKNNADDSDGDGRNGNGDAVNGGSLLNDPDDDEDDEDEDDDNNANLSSRLRFRAPKMIFDIDSDTFLLATVIQHMIISGQEDIEPSIDLRTRSAAFGNVALVFQAMRESWVDRYRNATELAIIKRWRILCKHASPMEEAGGIIRDAYKYAKLEYESGKQSRRKRDESLLNALLSIKSTEESDEPVGIQEQVQRVTDAIQGRERAPEGKNWEMSGEWTPDIQQRTSVMARQILFNNSFKSRQNVAHDDDMDVEQDHIDDEDGGFNGAAASVDDDDVEKEEETETEKVANEKMKNVEAAEAEKEKEEKGPDTETEIGNEEDKAGATGDAKASERRPKLDPSKWLVLDEVKCEVCGRGDREDEVLLCDGCDNGFHIFCLKPALKKIPDDEWFCERCKAALEPTDEGDEYVPRPTRTRNAGVPARVVAPPPVYRENGEDMGLAMGGRRKVAKKFTQIKFNEERRARNDSVGEPIIEIRKKAIEIFNSMFANKYSEETANTNGVTKEILPVHEINAASMLAYISGMITNKIDMVSLAEHEEVNNPSDAKWAFKVLAKNSKECSAFGLKTSGEKIQRGFKLIDAEDNDNNMEDEDAMDIGETDPNVEQEVTRYVSARLNASESDIVEFIGGDSSSTKRALKALAVRGELLLRTVRVHHSGVPSIFMKVEKSNDRATTNAKTENFYCVPIENQRV